MITTLILAAVLAGTAAAEDVGFVSARPVWADGRTAESNLTVSFRTTFDWKDGTGPVCRLAASTVYRAFLNGEFVSWGPARTVSGHACIDEFRLSPRPGRNVLTVEVAGYNLASYQYNGDSPFFCLEILRDGKPVVATPADFAAIEVPRAKTGPTYSRQRGFIAEAYEIDRDFPSWTRGGPSSRPTLPLAAVPAPVWLKRASSLPAFKVNDGFVRASNGEWHLPAIDSGFVGLTLRCRRPGRIAVEFDEAVDKGGRIDLNRNGDPTASWHAMYNRITWDVREAGEYRLESIEPYTLKYARIVADEGAFEDVRPYVRQCRNPLVDRARFSCSDPELDRLFAAARNSVAQNAVDLFTDCPSRERVGWLCDTYFTATAAAWLSGDFSLEQEYLLNFTRTDDFGPNIPKDAIPGFMPSRSGSLMPTYMMWYVAQCVQAAERLAPDARAAFAGQVRNRIERVLSYLGGFEKEGLLENLPGWVFIEWSKANGYVKGVNYPANMLWAFALDGAGRLYGRTDWRDKARAVRDRVRADSLREGCYHDQALRGTDGRLALNPGTKTEVCQYYAFFTGLETPRTQPALWRRMVDEFGPGRGGAEGMDPADAFIGWMLRCVLLDRFGESQELRRSVKAYYGKMAEVSGTLWEFADGHDSRCHAFGGNVATLILGDALGIARIDRANRRLCLRKPSAGLSHAEGRIPLSADAFVEITVDGRNGEPVRKVVLPSGWTQEDASPAEPAVWPAKDLSAWKPLEVRIRSTADGSLQPAFFHLPTARRPGEKVPLVVFLHTWSCAYTTLDPAAWGINEAEKRGWAFLYPHFRGPNWTPAACGSDLAVQDIVDAVRWAIAQGDIDPDRVYLIGASGGGHMALLQAGRHPELWAAVYAACPPADLKRWHAQCLAQPPGNSNRVYAKNMEDACGGTPEVRPDEYARRSSTTYLAGARDVPIQISTGIHDGHVFRGAEHSVPPGQSVRCFNLLADPKDRIGEDDIAVMEREERVPEPLLFRGKDPFFASGELLLNRISHNVRLTLHSGGHAGNFAAALAWFERQRRGRPVTWETEGRADGPLKEATR